MDEAPIFEYAIVANVLATPAFRMAIAALLDREQGGINPRCTAQKSDPAVHTGIGADNAWDRGADVLYAAHVMPRVVHVVHPLWNLDLT